MNFAILRYNYECLKMNIIDFYYNEDTRGLYIEFSLLDDMDNVYRTIELSFKDVEYYSPTIISKNDMNSIDKDFIIDMLNQYFSENDLPEEKFL